MSDTHTESNEVQVAAHNPNLKNLHPMVAMLSAGYVQKDKHNKQSNFDYASDEAVTHKVREIMQSAGLYVKSAIVDQLHLSRIEVRNGEMNYCVAVMSITLADSDGTEYGPYQGIGGGADYADKAPMKACTSARKYALAQAGVISWGNDPEADTSVDLATKPHSDTPQQSRKPQGPAKPPGHAVAETAGKIAKALDACCRNGDLEQAEVLWRVQSPAVKQHLYANYKATLAALQKARESA